ncbi:hypothetical protein BC826DRAFT_705484 [Russula brevipes]|nr:hypothetical protein BC826DRAFT_705484 [Russula brevipes]
MSVITRQEVARGRINCHTFVAEPNWVKRFSSLPGHPAMIALLQLLCWFRLQVLVPSLCSFPSIFPGVRVHLRDPSAQAVLSVRASHGAVRCCGSYSNTSMFERTSFKRRMSFRWQGGDHCLSITSRFVSSHRPTRWLRLAVSCILYKNFCDETCASSRRIHEHSLAS